MHDCSCHVNMTISSKWTTHSTDHAKVDQPLNETKAHKHTHTHMTEMCNTITLQAHSYFTLTRNAAMLLARPQSNILLMYVTL